MRPQSRFEGQADVGIADDDLKKMYRLMVLTRVTDTQAVSLQRQGRIGFYVPCEGEEAAEVGSVFALEHTDWVFPDYRGSGIAIARGMPLQTLLAQVLGNSRDLLKGRSMPSHWGSKALNLVAPSSPICTQLPHAVGVALGAKMNGDRMVTLTYFGDGGTSSNDFHSGMNFAAVFKTPTVFLCRNNGYAISVPVGRQTATKSLVEKAAAYNMEGVRVDGNDILAVYAATKKAVDKARDGGGPTFIEAVTYRLGAHTTSDDPTRYREARELEAMRASDPIVRFKQYLIKTGRWTEAEDAELARSSLQQVKEAFAEVEKAQPVTYGSLFDDVYSRRTRELEAEAAELRRETGED